MKTNAFSMFFNFWGFRFQDAPEIGQDRTKMSQKRRKMSQERFQDGTKIGQECAKLFTQEPRGLVLMVFDFRWNHEQFLKAIFPHVFYNIWDCGPKMRRRCSEQSARSEWSERSELHSLRARCELPYHPTKDKKNRIRFCFGSP